MDKNNVYIIVEFPSPYILTTSNYNINIIGVFTKSEDAHNYIGLHGISRNLIIYQSQLNPINRIVKDISYIN